MHFIANTVPLIFAGNIHYTGCERYWRPLLKVIYCLSRQQNFEVILSKDFFLPLLSNSSVFSLIINRMLQEGRKEPLSQGSAPGRSTGRWLTSTTSPATLWRILPWSTSIFMKKEHYKEFNIKRKHYWAALRPQQYLQNVTFESIQEPINEDTGQSMRQWFWRGLAS